MVLCNTCGYSIRIVSVEYKTKYICDYCDLEITDKHSGKNELTAYLIALYKSQPNRTVDEQTFIENGKLNQNKKSDIDPDWIKTKLAKERQEKEKLNQKLKQEQIDAKLKKINQEIDNCKMEYEKLEIKGNWATDYNIKQTYYKDALELIMTEIYDRVKKQV